MKKFKYGLKLWSNNENYSCSARELHAEGIYDYIELYIVPNTYKQYIEIWKNIDVPYVIHCTQSIHGFNLAIEEKFKDNLGMFSEVRDFAEVLNAKYIIIHPGVKGDAKTTIRQIKALDDRRLLIENKPYVSLFGDSCRGSTYEELKEILSSRKDIGFCLDVSHVINTAFYLGIDSFFYLKQMLSLSPKVIHLCDGEIGEGPHKHLNIGEGDFDFVKIGELIKSSKVEYLTVETRKNDNGLYDFVEDVRKIKEFIK